MYLVPGGVWFWGGWCSGGCLLQGGGVCLGGGMGAVCSGEVSAPEGGG